jgi:hypothetical protein
MTQRTQPKDPKPQAVKEAVEAKTRPEPGKEASFEEAMRETLTEDAAVFKRLAEYDAQLGD